MFARNGVSLAFLLVSVGVLLIVAPAVHGDDCNSQNAGDSGEVSTFFKKIGCGLKSGAKTVSESVQDGYKYVKNKVKDFNSDPTTPTPNLISGNTEKPIPLAPLN